MSIDRRTEETEHPNTADEAAGARTPEPLPPPLPVPPEALKPWYYQGWFLVPTFVWWPCTAILFIRSPWHNGMVSGALSWAWLIVGGGFIFLRMQYHWQNGEPVVADPTLWALAMPGIALTVITQTLWLTRDRPRIRRIREAGGFAAYEDVNADAQMRPVAPSAPPERRRRSNRGSARSRRRRR